MHAIVTLVLCTVWIFVLEKKARCSILACSDGEHVGHLRMFETK
jgi:hypothetical protein